LAFDLEQEVGRLGGLTLLQGVARQQYNRTLGGRPPDPVRRGYSSVLTYITPSGWDAR